MVGVLPGRPFTLTAFAVTVILPRSGAFAGMIATLVKLYDLGEPLTVVVMVVSSFVGQFASPWKRIEVRPTPSGCSAVAATDKPMPAGVLSPLIGDVMVTLGPETRSARRVTLSTRPALSDAITRITRLSSELSTGTTGLRYRRMTVSFKPARKLPVAGMVAGVYRFDSTRVPRSPLPGILRPSIEADLSALSSCKRTTTSSDSPTLTRAPADGVSIAIVRAFAPLLVDEPDGPTLIGDVDSRESQLATIATPPRTTARRTTKCRIINS